MTFEQLIAICQPVSVSGPEPDEIGTLTQDSRKVTEGSAFIAVKGFRVDGHRFIEDAISKGASVVICEDSSYSKNGVCILEVSNTRSLVGPLAQAFEGNPAEELTLTGITGTNGKTTVATLTYQILKKLGARPSLLGTAGKRIDDKALDSLLTTSDPIELARDMRRMIEAGSRHLVMEVSSHALDQQRTAGLNFRVAAFTNLSHDHLDYHSGLREYAQSKKQLFDRLNPEACAIINADDGQAEFIVKDCRAKVVHFSLKNDADISCRIISGSSKGLTIDIEEKEINSPLIGTFNAYNIIEAFLICRALGYEDEAIAGAMPSATGAAGRMERVHLPADEQDDAPLVLVDYAHTPDALKNVLRTLADLKTREQTLHVIFGCGGDRDKAKRPKMAAVSEQYADRITVTSDNPRHEDPEAIIKDAMKGFKDPAAIKRISNRKTAIEQAVTEADTNTIILIAGKGHETYQEINETRHHFDDREIAREALGKRPVNTNSNGGA